MTAKDWEKLKKDAQETLETIDVKKLTKSSYTLLGASLAILDHDGDSMPITALASPSEPHERTPEYYAEDELTSASEYHKMGLDWIARDELKHAAYWIEQVLKNKHEYQTRYNELEKQIGKVMNNG